MQYKFKKSITGSQIDQLVKYSQTDPIIIKFTSDPIRFKDKTSATEWLGKKVSVYTLSDKDGNLIGITWFHKKPLPIRDFTTNLNSNDYPLTFAIRIYGKARGKGLSFNFMKQSFDDLNLETVWIETSFDNIPTIKLAEKFGFKKVSDPDPRGKIIMTRNQP